MKLPLALLCVASLTPPVVYSANLTYYGGPVVGNAQVVMVNWGSAVPSSVQVNLPYLYNDIVQSDYWTIFSEYATTINGNDGMAGSNQQIGFGAFVQEFTITPAICNNPTTTCTVTDTQINAELNNQIVNTHVLPPPATDGAGNVNTVYMVHFPPYVTVATYGGGSTLSKSCVDFCAIYSNFMTGGITAPAGLIPDQGGACAGGCGGGASTYLDTETFTSAYMLANVVTDPLLPSVTGSSAARPAAWYDTNFPSGGNISDKCYFNNTDAGAVIANGHTYTVPKLWSNSQNTCIRTTNKLVVKPSADANGTISPSAMQAVVTGNSTAFTVTANAGFTAVVGGTCGGNLAGTTYTTNPITADCTVVASFIDRIFANGFEP